MRLVNFAHRAISENLTPGSYAIDLTCGNGKDTFFLAKTVGLFGKVFAFDIQATAVAKTKDFLSARDCITQSNCTVCCHSEFSNHIPESLYGKISAVMMNLGYLPNGDHELTTQPETTVTAITKAFGWLKKNGLMSILVYQGHPSGKLESLAVKTLISQKKWGCVTEYGKQKEDSPILYIITKHQTD